MIQITLDVESAAAQKAVFDKASQLEALKPNVLEELGRFTAFEMQKATPVHTGELRESISYQVEENRVVIGPTAPYAKYVEYGTGPHPIYPRSARVLAFEVGGRTVFAKRVMHPGFAGRFFVKATADEVKGKIADFVKRMVVEALK